LAVGAGPANHERLTEGINNQGIPAPARGSSLIILTQQPSTSIALQPPLPITTYHTSFESSSTNLSIHIQHQTCLPRKPPPLPRRRRPPPLRSNLRIEVSQCSIFSPNAVALLPRQVRFGREYPLTGFCRYDQGGYPHCESRPTRAKSSCCCFA